MLFVGNVVADAFGFLPLVRAAFASLRRQLEAAADDRAVAAVGDPDILVRAIAKAALYSTPAAVAPLAAGAEVSERLDRLARPRRSSRPASAVAALGGLLVALALVVSVCLAAHAGPLPAKSLLCVAALGTLTLPSLVGGRNVGTPATIGSGSR